MSTPPTVGITGARGYVGSVVASALTDAGLDVVELVRARAAGGGTRRAGGPGGGAAAGGGTRRAVDAAAGDAGGGTRRHFDLGEEPGPALLEGLDALVHCAWDLRLARYDDLWRVNVEGTNRLVWLAQRTGTKRVVFVSSMSAYDGTSQRYGLTKLACERVVLAAGGSVVRLGLVYGPRAGGMVGSLRSMGGLPVVPVIAGQAKHFTVHEDDVGSSLLKLVTAAEVPTVPLSVAHPEPVAFEHILRTVAAEGGRRPYFVPVPWPAVYLALRAGEALGVALPFRSDSLLGLVRPAPVAANQEAGRALGLELRPFPR